MIPSGAAGCREPRRRSSVLGRWAASSAQQHKTKTIKRMNIPAGERVPETGNYGCTNCIVASALSGLFAAMSNSGSASPETLEGRTIRYFEKGSVFPECPNCGRLTGWCVTDTNPSEATAPTALQGAVSRVMQGSSQCDVCGDTVDVGAIKIVEPSLLVVATKSGYVPTRLPASWKPQCDMLGVSVASHWATVVKLNSSDDWKLCKRCSDEVGSFQSIPFFIRMDRRSPKTQQTKWWEFWK